MAAITNFLANPPSNLTSPSPYALSLSRSPHAYSTQTPFASTKAATIVSLIPIAALIVAFSHLSLVFDPFSTRSSLSQILNVMDQFMDSPVAAGLRRNWEAKETTDGLHMRMDMSGLGKEDVKVSVEQNTLIIRGEGKKESEDDESVRKYSSRIDLPEKLYKTDGIKGEMKNGVLKLFVAKIKEEERSDVFHVNVE